jgi:hypothetical protein
MDAHLKAVEQISRESDTQVKGDKKTPAARRNATMAVMVEGALRRRLSGLRRTLRRVASPRYRQLRRNLADKRSLMSRLEASRLPNPLPAAHPHRFQ